jgi:hypothetical protein
MNQNDPDHLLTNYLKQENILGELANLLIPYDGIVSHINLMIVIISNLLERVIVTAFASIEEISGSNAWRIVEVKV